MKGVPESCTCYIGTEEFSFFDHVVRDNMTTVIFRDFPPASLCFLILFRPHRTLFLPGAAAVNGRQKGEKGGCSPNRPAGSSIVSRSSPLRCAGGTLVLLIIIDAGDFNMI